MNKAFAYSFIESFNNTFSYTNVWTLNSTNDGDINFTALPESITLQSKSYNFPLITSTNVFPETGNFEIDFMFQYHNNSNEFGTGIVISDNKPSTYPYINSSSNSMLQVWQDGTNHLNFAATIAPKTGYAYTYISGFYIFKKTSSGDTDKHFVKIKYINNKYFFYLDDNLIYESIETSRRPNSIWFGNPIQVNQLLGWYSFSIDYIKINKLPTKVIDVPHFSQIDPNWKDEQYDHSSQTTWGTHSIAQWGCAMTSANMILSNYGYNFGPTLTMISNPSNLNTYLNNNSGYNGNAGLNWPAIAKYARGSKAIHEEYSKNKNLEFSYLPYDFDTIKSDIDNNKPDIVQIITNDQGTTSYDDDDLHFVVAKGYDEENNVYINDPLTLESSDTLTLQGAYPDKEYRKIGRFNPSDSDLSYIWLTMLNKQHAMIEFNGQKTGIDTNGIKYQEITNADYYQEGGYGGGGSASYFILPKPSTGTYTLSVSGNPRDEIKFELITYKEDASDTKHYLTDNVESDGTNTYLLDYSPLVTESASTFTKIPDPIPTPIPTMVPTPTTVPTSIPTTVPSPTPKPEPETNLFNELQKYIMQAYRNHDIKTRVYRDLLLLKVELAQWLYDRGNLRACQAMLDYIQRSVEKTHKNQIKQSTAQIIIEKVEQIKTELNL